MIKSLLIYLQVISCWGMWWGIKPVAAREISPICPSALAQEMETIIEDDTWQKARWGIVVESLDQGETLYSTEAEEYFVPASTLKLLTTAAALTVLGPQFRIITPIYTSGEGPHLNSLRVVGRGDPSLTTEDLETLVERLKNEGVKTIDNLIVEDSYFLDNSLHPTWEWFDIYYYYGAVANSLILNQNQVELVITPQKIGEKAVLAWSDPIAARQWNLDNQTITQVEAKEPLAVQGRLGERSLTLAGEISPGESESLDLAIASPSQYFLATLDSLLLAQGIAVRTAQLWDTPSISSETAQEHLTSVPLAELIAPVNQESNNLYAEVLFKIIEAETQKSLPELLTPLGIDPDSYRLVDGSGLSRHNLVTPQALVDTLKLMAQSDLGPVYQASLAQAGVNGTLENRFLGTSVEGNLWAKTGGMTGVASLAGYLYPPDHPPLVFAIILNHSPYGSRQMNQSIEQIVLLLNRLQNCS